MENKVEISEMLDRGDPRGSSYSVPANALAFVGRLMDLHMAQIRPGAVRGNHFHLRRREAILVQPGPRWSLHWDEGEGTIAEHQPFDGTKAVLVLVWPGASHAIRNDGIGDLWFTAISSESYDPAESVTRKVV